MEFVPGGEGFTPGSDHANLNVLAWCTTHISSSSSRVATQVLSSADTCFGLVI